jgi:tetratricopeptide (TPR) repeat protein
LTRQQVSPTACIEDMERALDIDPELLEAKLILALLEAGMGESGTALQHLTEAMRQLDQRREFLSGVVDAAVVLAQRGEAAAALAAIKQAHAEGPARASGWSQRSTNDKVQEPRCISSSACDPKRTSSATRARLVLGASTHKSQSTRLTQSWNVDSQREGRGRLQRVDLDTIKKWPRCGASTGCSR